MKKARVLELVRNFPQNGMKLLLESPANVRDLLRMTAPQFVDLIEFERMSPERAHFIARDFRHVEADIVLRAPLRRVRSTPQRQVIVYILIEHQSEPDRLMPLRLLDYVTQIHKTQLRDWTQRNRTFNGFRLQPVLPIVLYTGERSWPDVGSLTKLMDFGELFAAVTPAFAPLFFNLPTVSENLVREGGAFGAVLRLYHERKADLATFRARLAEVVREVEASPVRERLRWLEVLSYFSALIYHVRKDEEHSELIEVVAHAATSDEDRRALMAVKQTMAQYLEKKGSLEFGRSTLLRQLHLRFGELPDEVTNRIESTDKLKVLSTWLDRVTTAKSLDDIGILRQNSSRG